MEKMMKGNKEKKGRREERGEEWNEGKKKTTVTEILQCLSRPSQLPISA